MFDIEFDDLCRTLTEVDFSDETLERLARDHLGWTEGEPFPGFCVYDAGTRDIVAGG